MSPTNRPFGKTLAALGLPAAVLALGGCGASGEPASPGAVSEGEAEALDEAASMLDETRLPEGALPEIEAPASEDADAATPRSSGAAR